MIRSDEYEGYVPVGTWCVYEQDGWIGLGRVYRRPATSENVRYWTVALAGDLDREFPGDGECYWLPSPAYLLDAAEITALRLSDPDDRRALLAEWIAACSDPEVPR